MVSLYRPQESVDKCLLVDLRQIRLRWYRWVFLLNATPTLCGGATWLNSSLQTASNYWCLNPESRANNYTCSHVQSRGRWIGESTPSNCTWMNKERIMRKNVSRSTNALSPTSIDTFWWWPVNASFYWSFSARNIEIFSFDISEYKSSGHGNVGLASLLLLLEKGMNWWSRITYFLNGRAWFRLAFRFGAWHEAWLSASMNHNRGRLLEVLGLVRRSRIRGQSFYLTGDQALLGHGGVSSESQTKVLSVLPAYSYPTLLLSWHVDGPTSVIWMSAQTQLFHTWHY